jgi:carboxypeptidase T
MKPIFILVLLCCVSFGLNAQEYSRLRIPLNAVVTLERLASLGLEVDHGSHQKIYFESDFSGEEKNLLLANQIPFEVRIADVQAYYRNRMETVDKKTRSVNCHAPAPQYTTPNGFSYGNMGGYYTLQDAYEALDTLAALYPNLVTVKAPIGSYTTAEGRPIYWVKISDNANTNEGEPEILFDAAHHAREAVTVSQLIYFMYYLCENYASNAEVKRLVDNIEFYFVPVVNPDGYQYNYITDPTGGGLWRKNRRNNGGNTFGVDLNRNYGTGWGFNNIGSSATPSSSTYRGTAGFSEPETQAMRDFCNAHEFTFAMNYHSFSNLLIYPWGYLGKNCDDSVAFRSFAADLSKYNYYKYGTDLETVGYSTNGSSDDWMYGEVNTKPLIFAMTPEVGNEFDGFWPAQNRIIPLCQEALHMNLTIANYVLQYAQVDPITPRLQTGSNGNITFQITRLGLDSTASFTVSLQPLGTQITAVGSPKIFSGLTLGQVYTDSISYTLQNNLPPNTSVSFVLTTTFGTTTQLDTVQIWVGPLLEVLQSNGSNLAGWQNLGWAIDANRYTSAGGSFAENSSGFYSNTYDADLISPNINLSNATHAELLYRANWEIENSWDYVLLEVSTNGTSYTPICTPYTQLSNDAQMPYEIYTGVVTDWKYERVLLDDFLGASNVTLRWTFHSDNGLNMQGFNMDDIVVRKMDATPANVSNNEAEAFKVYPNPVTQGELHVQTSTPCSYQIFSADGRLVQEGNARETIHLFPNLQGMYQLVIRQQGEVKLRKSILILP